MLRIPLGWEHAGGHVFWIIRDDTSLSLSFEDFSLRTGRLNLGSIQSVDVAAWRAAAASAQPLLQEPLSGHLHGAQSSSAANKPSQAEVSGDIICLHLPPPHHQCHSVTHPHRHKLFSCELYVLFHCTSQYEDDARNINGSLAAMRRSLWPSLERTPVSPNTNHFNKVSTCIFVSAAPG